MNESAASSSLPFPESRRFSLSTLALAVRGMSGDKSEVGERTAVIVQARDMAAATAAVGSVGGEITHELGIIDAVGAITDA